MAFDEVWDAVEADQPILIAMTVSPAFFTPDGDGVVDTTEPESPDLRHAVLAVATGKRGKKKLVLVRSSGATLGACPGTPGLAVAGGTVATSDALSDNVAQGGQGGQGGQRGYGGNGGSGYGGGLYVANGSVTQKNDHIRLNLSEGGAGGAGGEGGLVSANTGGVGGQRGNGGNGYGGGAAVAHRKVTFDYDTIENNTAQAGAASAGAAAPGNPIPVWVQLRRTRRGQRRRRQYHRRRLVLYRRSCHPGRHTD